MTVLAVETGSGSNPAANCYCDVTDCDDYFADRGKVAWTGNAAAKEAAILLAADYLDVAYTWKGVRLTDQQPMQWPRDIFGLDTDTLLSSVNVNVVPPEVKRANIELALLALSGDLMGEQTGGKLLSESVSLGGAVSRSRTYAGGGADPTARRFPMIDAMLRRVITGGGGTGVSAQRIERG